jgi:tetraacyldisaccharide 4'-kinase
MKFERSKGILAWIMAPFSLLYGLVVYTRNLLYDTHVFRQEEFDIPLISVGNITVGGTGKTPHVEYLIELLNSTHKIAVLSRGYKRKTKGFRMAGPGTTAQDIGDEPYQLHKKYPGLVVATDRKRTQGIQKLMQIFPDLEVILLDDAFQHRAVKPGLSILLIDYDRPILEDHLLPYGDLRESPAERTRANIILITKSPAEIKPIEKRIQVKNLKILPYQTLYYTGIRYGSLKPLYNESLNETLELEDLLSYHVLLVTGIANPNPLVSILAKKSGKLETILFPDHHWFTGTDLDKIEQKFASMVGIRKIIITTEKDMSRFVEDELPDSLKNHLHVLPIQVYFTNNEESNFNKQIMHYVRSNKRNSLLLKQKNRI